nr:ATP-binding protein [Dawidia soli]
MKPFNEDKTILVHTDVAPLYISSDDVKFFQVVHNLVSNAVKFTPAEGTVAVDIHDSETTVVITVVDNGVGIPEHLQRHIFERNTPAGRPGLKGEKSIGMGLYIVRKLTELMHGEVTFTSREHAGSTFAITLPKIKPDA